MVHFAALIFWAERGEVGHIFTKADFSYRKNYFGLCGFVVCWEQKLLKALCSYFISLQ